MHEVKFCKIYSNNISCTYNKLPTQQQNFSLPVLNVNNTESINVMVACTNGTKLRRCKNNINNDTITFNRQTEADEDDDEEEEEEDDDAGGGGIGGLLKMFLAPLSGVKYIEICKYFIMCSMRLIDNINWKLIICMTT